MSVYDFNHNEHNNSNNNNANQAAHGNSNGTSQTRYQIQTGYLSHPIYPSNQNNTDNNTNNHHHIHNQNQHQMDISMQLTRPTSKTAMLVRQRRAMLEQLSCYLCKGYLIDATTIDECMDSFCKSCIVIYLRAHNNCPKCGTLIHKTNPLSTIRSDKVLQDIVYKLVPGLYDDEMKRRREFYKGMFATGSSSEDDEDSSSSSFNGRGSTMSSEHYGVISHPKPFYKPTDSIDLSIEPQTRGDCTSIYYDNKRQSIVTCFTGNLQQHQASNGGSIFSTIDGQQFKTYLRCPAKLTALQLKKFIASKFNICKDDTIHLLYLNESLKSEYSLIDIAYIYDWRGIDHMRLFYIIERDLSKTNESSNDKDGGQAHRIKSSQSVGTPTQAVKRVCIDPNPKFYKEQPKSRVMACGRNMRSRVEPTASAIKTNPDQQPTQAPILRSSSSATKQLEQCNSQLGFVNGTPNRETLVHGNNTGSSPDSSTVAAAIEELSRLKQDPRSNNKMIAGKLTSTASKVSTGYSPQPSNKANDARDKNASANNETRTPTMGAQQQGSTNRNNNNFVGSLVPFRGTGLSIPNAIRPSQSSMVTLASFTEARSNHVMTMTAGSSTAISNSYKNILGVGTSKLEVKSEVKSNQLNPAQSAAPQLAFSYVTERGITIVRRLNNRDEAIVGQAAISSRPNTQLPALPASSTQNSNTGKERTSPSQSNFTGVAMSSSASSSSGSSNHASQHHSNSPGHEGANARHLTKVKPVYKTFVDPTKLKSPNFKKLGYTARH